MWVVKLLGLVDIITAMIILTDIKLVFLTVPLFLVLLIKGATSLAADIVGKFYGVIDIISAFIIVIGIGLPIAVEVIIIAVLLFKGVTSLL